MKKHLRYFENISDYNIAESGGGLVLPNVIYIKSQESVYYNPVPPVIPDYFKITALENLEIGFEGLYVFSRDIQPITVSLEYSLDGEKWNIWDFSNISVKKEEKVYFRGENIKFSSYDSNRDDIYVNRFLSTGKFNISGNILSLLYGEDFDNPVKSLPEDCFNSLFESQTYLINAGELKLPATTLGNFCYQSLFSGCTSLTTTPELPATTLADYCYRGMFRGCTSLTTAPTLPAITLAECCYSYMFEGCISLTEAPELPATTLYYECYSGMFSGCTSLTTTPELPATTLAERCYYSMFSFCSSLTIAPELPATTLADWCYSNMFDGCTSLTAAPQLPATTLAYGCYYYMFQDCTSLTTAPQLPATTLVSDCYDSMFRGCTSLTTAPELPATRLSEYCYQYMFNGCTSLNNIVMLATNISASNCLLNWVNGVASAGTFIKNINMTSLPSGASGIPSGWEVRDHITPIECTNLTITADDVIGNYTTTIIHYTATCNGIDYKGDTVIGFAKEGTAVSAEFPQNTSETETIERTITFEFMGITASTVITQGVYIHFEQHYLTFETIEDSTFKLSRNACEYSLDGGETWVSLSANTNTPTVPAGNKIMFRATNPTISNYNGIGVFSSTGKFNVSGNIMSMLYGDDFIGQIDLTGKDHALCGLFMYCSNVVEAHNLILPATTLASYCYYNIFWYCTSLTTAPELPATTLAGDCYEYMFYNCRSLVTAPELPATILASSCYNGMFYDCRSLVTAPELPATTLNLGCYYNMFYGCTSLTTAPQLPATTLASTCYYGMFEGCSSLTTAPQLPATTLAGWCYRNMFQNCTSLITAPQLPATTLANNCYYQMFAGCRSLTTAPQLPATTLYYECYYGMFEGCTSLNNIVMLATDISASNCLYNWVSGVASTGTFVKHPDMTSLSLSVNGIPSGWSVEDYNG